MTIKNKKAFTPLEVIETGEKHKTISTSNSLIFLGTNKPLTGFTPIRSKRLLTGFTLIELLVVIAIIAVLAAVSIPVVVGVVQRAQDSAITADMRSIHVQAVRIHIDTGNFDTIRCTGGNADIMAMCVAIDRANGEPTGTAATPPNVGIGNVVSHVAAAPAAHFCIQSRLHGGGYRCADRLGHWLIPATICGTDTDPGAGTALSCRSGHF